MEVKEETQEERKKREKKEYQKEYYETNRKEINKKMKEYREANKEVINQQRKDKYHMNKEEINKKRREKYVANKDKRKEYNEAHKEKISKKRREKYFRKKQEIEASAKQFQQPLWEKSIDIINKLKGTKVSPSIATQNAAAKKELVLQFQKEYKETHNIDVSKKSKEWLAKNPEYKKAWITFNANKKLDIKENVPEVVVVSTPPVIDNSLIEIAFLKEQLAQMQRVESLMKEMELILSSSSKEFQELGVKESTVKKNYEKSLDVIQETKKKLFKKENKLKSKLKKDLKNISNRKYYLIQEFQKAQLKKTEEEKEKREV